jgi:uncharacterized membrane protein
MDDGVNGDVWFYADSRDGQVTDKTAQLYAFVGVGALALAAASWWWAPTTRVWLNVAIGIAVGALVGLVCFALSEWARNEARHRKFARLAKSDPEEFRRRYGPPNT